MGLSVPHKAGFFAELRRRRVLRVVGFYAISVWLVLQVTNIVFPALYLPQWLMTVVVIAIAAGFPIVAVLAWVFDLTPAGIVRTGPRDEADLFDDLPDDDTIVDSPRIWIDIAIIAVLLAIVAYLLVKPENIPLRSAEASIAVLPFVDVSERGDSMHFAEGLTAMLIDSVVRIPGVGVVARSGAPTMEPLVAPAAAHTDRSHSDLREIGRRVGASVVLDGTVWRDGNRVRVTARLVDVESGYHLWGDTFERVMGDVLALQDDIARAIARALRTRLAAAAPADRRRATPEAAELYVQGRGALRSLRRADIEDAIRHFNDALRVDPRFVPAEAGLCLAYVELYGITRESRLPQLAADACQTAGARAGDNPDIHVALGTLYRATGRPELAATEFVKALRLDPRHPDAMRGQGTVQWLLGDLVAAEATFRRVLEIEPDYWRGHAALGALLFHQGRYEESLAAFERGAARHPYDPHLLSNLGGAYLQLGEHERAQEAFVMSLAAYPTASAYVNLGNVFFYFSAQFARARDAYRHAVALAPGAFEYRTYLADACRLLGDSHCAEENYRMAITLGERQLEVDSADAYNTASLALMYARTGDGTRATPLLDAALAMAPNDREVLRVAAHVALIRSDTDAALALLGRARENGYPAHLLQRHPDLVGLQDDPRFLALVDDA